MAYLLTVEEIRNLERKIVQLENEAEDIRIEINEIISTDSEYLMNSRYIYLKSKLTIQIPNDIDKIKQKIKEAKLVKSEEFVFDGATVAVGTKVTLDYEGDIEELSILPIAENDIDSGRVSPEAPIVKLIMGKKTGEIVPFNDINVKIVNVEKI